MTQGDLAQENALSDEDVRSALLTWLQRQHGVVWFLWLGLSALLLIVVSVLSVVAFGGTAAFLDDTWLRILILAAVFAVASPIATYFATRRYKYVRRGIASHGLHACPGCGNDTRLKDWTCKICFAADERADVPGFWHLFVKRHETPLRAFLPSMRALQEFITVDPEVGRRRERRIKVELKIAVVLIIIGVVGGVLLSPSYYRLAFVAAFVYLSVVATRSALPNRFSKYGYCVHCKQELPPGERPTCCSECGEAFMRGSIVFGYSDRFNPFWFVVLGVLGAGLLYWEFVR